MATDQREHDVDQGEQILVRGELRPRNAFYIAVAETAARNKASSLPDPYPLKPLLELGLNGVSLSKTIIQDRG